VFIVPARPMAPIRHERRKFDQYKEQCAAHSAALAQAALKRQVQPPAATTGGISPAVGLTDTSILLDTPAATTGGISPAGSLTDPFFFLCFRCRRGAPPAGVWRQRAAAAYGDEKVANRDIRVGHGDRKGMP
jgi:hypothetical protein